MLTALFDQLESWPVAAALRTSVTVYPLVTAGHIFGIALLIGAIVPVDLRLLGVFHRVSLPDLATVLIRFAATGLGIAAVSGFLLFAVNPHEYAANPAFLTKISLVAVGTANALALRVTSGWQRACKGGTITPGLRASAVVSLAVWPAALISGRWIGFL
ncbi:DUF2214 domain-containing protein [Fodinicurvata sp. EGI_FJ10296]|uniref:DUF2214 domain-containing protein n=1 Tax=Fodinicurvata sp. EGI_FJ10296 TaxID=3231908 RepID=UPI0034511DF5